MRHILKHNGRKFFVFEFEMDAAMVILIAKSQTDNKLDAFEKTYYVTIFFYF